MFWRDSCISFKEAYPGYMIRMLGLRIILSEEQYEDMKGKLCIWFQGDKPRAEEPIKQFPEIMVTYILSVLFTPASRLTYSMVQENGPRRVYRFLARKGERRVISENIIAVMDGFATIADITGDRFPRN